jgi:hypothetical protein
MERDLRYEYQIQKEKRDLEEEERRRQKYIAERGLRSTFYEKQKALNEMTEVELKSKNRNLMYY